MELSPSESRTVAVIDAVIADWRYWAALTFAASLFIAYASGIHTEIGYVSLPFAVLAFLGAPLLLVSMLLSPLIVAWGPVENDGALYFLIPLAILVVSSYYAGIVAVARRARLRQRGHRMVAGVATAVIVLNALAIAVVMRYPNLPFLL